MDIKKYKFNIRLYAKYKMFAYDWLFFYAINIMYYTITKGFSVSDVMYISGFYTLSMVFWQFFSSFIASKLGLKKTMLLGNIFVTINSIIYIFATDFKLFILANFIGALGFSLKSLSEGSLLYSSLKYLRKRKDFSKIEGNANSKYYYLDAITALISGFLFVINQYLPIILCTIFNIISLIISSRFYDIKNTDDENGISAFENINIIKNIFKSNRTKAMLSFAFVFYGLITIVDTLYKAIILDIGIKNEYTAIIVAIVTIFVGIGAKFLFKIESIAKNKTLTVFSVILVLSMFVIGYLGYINKLNLLTLALFLMALVIFAIVKGAYRVAMKKYVLSFTTHKMRNQITSIYYMLENLGTTIISFISGWVLEYTTNSISCIIFALFSFVLLIILLNYMKDKIGLKPEEYDKVDINNTKI